MTSVHPDLQALIERRRSELGFGGQPMSIRAVSRQAVDRGHKLSPETVRRLVNGSHSGVVDDSTVDGLATALDVSRGEVLRAMHETRQQSLGPWQPPSTASRLSLRQRRALEQIIAAMVEPATAEEGDPGVDLVAVGDEGLFVAQAKGASQLGLDDREVNEEIADQALDQMEKDQQTRRRFGGR